MSESVEVVLLRESTRFLPVELTPEQMQEKVSLVSHLFGLRDEMEVRHKEEKDRIKSEAERMAARIERESEIVRKKSEDQEVVVKTILYLASARVVTVRADTGEEISDGRPATQDELQRSLLEPEAPNFLDSPEARKAFKDEIEGHDFGDGLKTTVSFPGRENGETDGDD